MQPKNQKSTYRQRGFKCQVCQMHTLTFGSDPAPVDCPSCKSETSMTKLWDHLVTQITYVGDYSEVN